MHQIKSLSTHWLTNSPQLIGFSYPVGKGVKVKKLLKCQRVSCFPGQLMTNGVALSAHIKANSVRPSRNNWKIQQFPVSVVAHSIQNF